MTIPEVTAQEVLNTEPLEDLYEPDYDYNKEYAREKELNFHED
jgi:hypothetical protein